MVRSFLHTLALLLCATAVWSQTTLQGSVKDRETGEALIGATVKIMNGTQIVRGVITDYDGNYRASIDPGSYNIEVSYTGYQTERTAGVQVLSGKANFYDVTISTSAQIQEVVIKEYIVPLIQKDNTSGGQTLTSKEIRNLPQKGVNAIAATTPGLSSIDGGDINIKGARSAGTNYYVDGIRVSGATVPTQDIEQLQVITGGLGAEYGDVTGGVISITTKGPASTFGGGVEAETSQGLDAFGYNTVNANLSGPILKKKNGTPIVGFRLSGEFLTNYEDDPPATSIYVVKDDVRERLSAHPLFQDQNGAIFNSAERLTYDSVTALKARPNERSTAYGITSKFDFRVSDNIDMSLTGTYRNSRNKFTPNGWLLLNNVNNPTTLSQRARGIFRLRHRLGSGTDNTAGRVKLSNTYYQLQAGFERGWGSTEDPRHKDRLFDYGHIGRFNYNDRPVIGTSPDNRDSLIHTGYIPDFLGFEAGYVDGTGALQSANPGLVAYNEFANPELDFTYLLENGFTPSNYSGIWSGMHTNVNMVYNSVNKNLEDVLTLGATAGFDLKFGKSGVHNIQFGILHEERTSRNWSIAPVGLWQLADQSANIHYNGVDYSRPLGKIWNQEIQDSIVYYDHLLVPADSLPDNKFYKNLRASLGITDLHTYVNPNALTPDQLSLGMFGARELNDQGLLSYYGYDYLGNKLDKNLQFNDFFTHKDADGVRDLPNAALKPVYQAAYIKDKFTFKDIIFSLGARVERLDLNTRAMRDQFSLYEVISAKDFYTLDGAGTRPQAVQDDWKVYTKSESDKAIVAYRKGTQWYFPDGSTANDGNLIFGGGVVSPYYTGYAKGDPAAADASTNIKAENFDPNTAFADYEPQINWMPRLAFSFPISDDANFFAHYDILVERPTSNWQVTPLDYFYFYDNGRTPGNNANLKPQRVVDYEVGFQQKLTNSSALKFSAYYREFRDMIQSRQLSYIPVISNYTTYDNIDFGTVKGFTFQYDLRRIQNMEMRLAYTLQFADGTGSDANSQRGIGSRGIIRTKFPLNFDERHNISALIDYRFADGKQYNGPRISGKEILANAGANFQITAVSGRPYTAAERPEQFGGSGILGAINGNRLPWRLSVDMRLDKSFNLAAKGKKPFNANVYLRVTNLLNRKNVVGVYTYTGSPTEDGYLSSPRGEAALNNVNTSGLSPEAYLSSYSWVMNNPNNYSLPRRVFLGLVFDF